MLRKEQKATLRCGNQIIELSQPCVMGIVNATPDSFFAPSRTGNLVEKALELTDLMVSEGATIIDIGGISTRPGAEEIPVEEELARVLPVVGAIHTSFPKTVISIDTYRSEVAREACKAGATMINDISGGQGDGSIYKVAAEFHAAYVLMHMRGTPKTMQHRTDYQDVVADVLKYFVNQIKIAHQSGIRDIILDPGFGFAKTMEQNYQIINQLGIFGLLGYPILVGVSRKSTLSKTIGRTADEALYATTALHMAALLNGASILRVHDVRPALDAIAVYLSLESAGRLSLKNTHRI